MAGLYCSWDMPCVHAISGDQVVGFDLHCGILCGRITGCALLMIKNKWSTYSWGVKSALLIGQ